jgi:AP-1 complex subunit mu
MVQAKSNFKRRSTANNVEIIIPVPSDADSPTFKVCVPVPCLLTRTCSECACVCLSQTSIGTVQYYPEKDCIIWSIKQFVGQKEYFMRAHFGLPSVSSEENTLTKAPINVKFEIPYFTVSGVQVRYLKIIEKSGYQALPWVRYITQNGDYQLRVL